MLLTITTTHTPAGDLGYLLHKHPDRCQTFDLAFGKAHVFYPQVASDRCTAALLLDVDPIGLVRNRRPGGRTPVVCSSASRWSAASIPKVSPSWVTMLVT